MILALESSCDETAAALLSPPSKLLSNIVSSQAKEHEPYGGVVPELASRNHLVLLKPTVENALNKAGISFGEIDAFETVQTRIALPLEDTREEMRSCDAFQVGLKYASWREP